MTTAAPRFAVLPNRIIGGGTRGWWTADTERDELIDLYPTRDLAEAWVTYSNARHAARVTPAPTDIDTDERG